MTEVQSQNSSPISASNGVKTSKRPRRNFPALPSMPAASEMSDVAYSCKVDSSPTGWEALQLYSPFSLSPDGSYPLVKVSRSKACDLRTGKSLAVGSGRCYRVIF